MSELVVYKASAGSGKTFTLTVAYVSYLIAAPTDFRHILAVTFTNKATAGMKERILNTLYGLAAGESKTMSDYLEAIRRQSGLSSLSDKEICARALRALRLILHDYGRFRVETIDSFFQMVMRNLARELELNPNLNIELRQDEVLGEAVDSMIDKLTPQDKVLDWLIEFMEDKIAEGARWDIRREIKLFGRHIFNEIFADRGQTPAETIHDYRRRLRAEERRMRQTLCGYADRFDEILRQNELTPADLKGKTPHATYFRNLRAGELKEPAAAIGKSLASATEWASKNSPLGAAIVSIARAELIPLLERAEHDRAAFVRPYNSCRLSLRFLDQLQLLTHIENEVQTLNREKNRFLLAQTNAMLHRLIGADDPSFVFEKIGASLRHIMIDEFQDTSTLQWQNFRLLLLEGLAHGDDSLVVGDVKQSIYRWRGGDWRILNDMDESGKLGPHTIQPRILSRNWRSETEIVAFNNQIFSHIRQIIAARSADDPNPHRTAALVRAYSDVEQQPTRAERHGYVEVIFCDKETSADDGVDGDASYRDVMLRQTGAALSRLREAGVSAGDIAILTRTNNDLREVAAWIRRELDLPVISDEAFRLDASRAVLLLIAALRCLHDATDGVARAYLGAWLRDEAALTLLDERKAAWLRLPLYELLEELYRWLDAGRLGEDAYLCCFYDGVMEFMSGGSAALADFLTYWDETLCQKTLPAGDNDQGIRLLTIHKAKGLEFHTVIVPFCNWPLETGGGYHTHLVWSQANADAAAPFHELDLVPVAYGKAMAESFYSDAYYDERLQLRVDNLNVLYVALTRAARNLLVLGQQRAKTDRMSNLLGEALRQIAPDWTENMVFTRGEIVPSSERVAATASAPRELWLESLPPQVEFRQSNESKNFIGGHDETTSPFRFISRGKLLHRLLESIDSVDDASDGDDVAGKLADNIDRAVAALRDEGLIESTAAERELRDLLARAFASPVARAWYSSRWQLFRERDIISCDERGQLARRRPDRVMIDGVRAVVVDFKSGQPAASARNHYRRQVREYLTLLGAMGYTHVDGYIWYIESGLIEPVKLNSVRI